MPFRSFSLLKVSQCCRAITTISKPSSFSWLNRKLSLTIRLMRFLSTASLATRFPTIMPILACFFWLGRQSNVNQRWPTLSGSSKTRLKSALVTNRLLRGKLKITGLSHQAYGISRLRPLARRLLNTLRPSIVAMRARKPCFLLQGMTLGWNVLFIVACFHHPGLIKLTWYQAGSQW